MTDYTSSLYCCPLNSPRTCFLILRNILFTFRTLTSDFWPRFRSDFIDCTIIFFSRFEHWPPIGCYAIIFLLWSFFLLHRDPHTFLYRCLWARSSFIRILHRVPELISLAFNWPIVSFSPTFLKHCLFCILSYISYLPSLFPSYLFPDISRSSTSSPEEELWIPLHHQAIPGRSNHQQDTGTRQTETNRPSYCVISGTIPPPLHRELEQPPIIAPWRRDSP